jgi:hypothetical protein
LLDNRQQAQNKKPVADQPAPSASAFNETPVVNLVTSRENFVVGRRLRETLALCSRSSASTTFCQATTPLSSPFALSEQTLDFATDLAFGPYQLRDALAYIAAASSSVTNIELALSVRRQVDCGTRMTG